MALATMPSAMEDFAYCIHRSSLLKRLDKIQCLTGLDREDSDIRLYLRIFFRLQ